VQKLCNRDRETKNTIEEFDFELSKESIRNLFEYKKGELYYKKVIALNIKIGDKVEEYAIKKRKEINPSSGYHKNHGKEIVC